MQQQMAAQQQQLQEKVADMMEKFEAQMSNVIESISEADQAFGDIDGAKGPRLCEGHGEGWALEQRMMEEWLHVLHCGGLSCWA